LHIAVEVVVKDVAQFLKVLADEARLQMLTLLFTHDELCVCDLMEALGITQSKASRHLATLRHAGLVVDRREATWSYYSICPAGSDLERALLGVLRERLAEHPAAVQVRRDLEGWMERKERGATCGAACGPRSQGKSANRTRARAAGGKR
jgi:ArsR family transcriptional regulator, arsenate/arsenite/antimonite-responsive transcriptional repressor